MMDNRNVMKDAPDRQVSKDKPVERQPKLVRSMRSFALGIATGLLVGSATLSPVDVLHV